MLPQSRVLRLALVLLMSLGYVAWHGHTHAAYAKGSHGGGDDDDDGGGDDDGGDDDGGKGDDTAGGDDDDDGDDKDQPAVTSGGLFTLKTYPVRELWRPLTMTQGIAQIRFGVGTDLSAKGAFESFGLSVDGIYGLTDNFSLIGGLDDAYNFHQFNFYAGFEGALAYDLIDFRAALDINRPAIAKICDSPGAKACELDAMGMPVTGLPTGEYTSGNTLASIDLGFPFRYVAKPEIAIIALNTLMSIDLDGSKPDLKPSLGIATNPIAPLSVVIFAQLLIPNFDTSKGSFAIPATARVEFSPSQKLDLGLEFTFLNVKPATGAFYDNRFLTLFLQFRAGK
jgi:hypothetical protein